MEQDRIESQRLVSTKAIWAGGIAAAIAGGLSSTSAQASIIYTAVSEPVNATTTSATIAFESGLDPQGDIAYDSTNGLTLQKAQIQNGIGYIAAAPSTAVAAIPAGESIDATQTYSGLVLTAAELNNGDGTTGQFVQSMPPQTQYLGVDFGDSSSQEVFGWIGFEVLDDSSLANLSGIVTGFAYENSGAGIAAGAVPEPSSLALLALGAAGLAGYRRRSIK